MRTLALNRAKSIPIKQPYVDSVLFDFAYNGYCAQIKFEALRAYMISQGDINENDIDSRFYALIWIQVSIFLSTSCY